ncbi:MAG TPA: NUDIX domain-containing protein [Candidatus Saccharimonadales bacterium]|nr:NUDIX domain-containing protein [Candidatus Saccharimonadales bacterium]
MAEQVDVLDEHGRATGRTASRAEAHERGLWHATSHVLVIDSLKKVMMQVRAASVADGKNLHDLVVAEHVQAGETALDAAVRGVKEEYGLLVSPGQLQPILQIGMEVVKRVVPQQAPHRSFATAHVLQTNATIDDLTLQPEEVARVYQLDLDEVEKLARSQDPNNPTLLYRPPEYAQRLFPAVRAIIEA